MGGLLLQDIDVRWVNRNRACKYRALLKPALVHKARQYLRRQASQPSESRSRSACDNYCDEIQYAIHSWSYLKDFAVASH